MDINSNQYSGHNCVGDSREIMAAAADQQRPSTAMVPPLILPNVSPWCPDAVTNHQELACITTQDSIGGDGWYTVREDLNPPTCSQTEAAAVEDRALGDSPRISESSPSN